MSSTALCFDSGRVTVDLQARRLTVAGSVATVGGRSFDLLAALVAQRHRVVAKQDLLELVWPGRVVEENNLQVRVAALRRLLGRHAIVTVSGHGYKFALPQDAPLPSADDAPDGPREPATDGALLGRDALLAAALRLLQSGSGRWLALCGPGGSGKTRLALHIAQTLPAQVADSACVTLLAPVRAQAHVMAAIAAALGVQTPADEDGADRVTAFLRSRRLLLVLDNIEHLPDLHRDIAALLAACPQLKVLTTSRLRLHLPDDQELAVPPLGLPRDDRPASILDAPAVALFLHRAAAAGRPVDRSAATLRSVAAICRRLDGLPLAIELAAARLRVLTPDALLSRLQHRLSLLKAGAGQGGVPPRHQTLREALDWSRDLLTPDGQGLFGRLGVFVGGWSIDAAEAVASPGTVVADLLEELIDHHLGPAHRGRRGPAALRDAGDRARVRAGAPGRWRRRGHRA